MTQFNLLNTSLDIANIQTAPSLNETQPDNNKKSIQAFENLVLDHYSDSILDVSIKGLSKTFNSAQAHKLSGLLNTLLTVQMTDESRRAFRVGVEELQWNDAQKKLFVKNLSILLEIIKSEYPRTMGANSIENATKRAVLNILFHATKPEGIAMSSTLNTDLAYRYSPVQAQSSKMVPIHTVDCTTILNRCSEDCYKVRKHIYSTLIRLNNDCVSASVPNLIAYLLISDDIELSTELRIDELDANIMYQCTLTKKVDITPYNFMPGYLCNNYLVALQGLGFTNPDDHTIFSYYLRETSGVRQAIKILSMLGLILFNAAPLIEQCLTNDPLKDRETKLKNLRKELHKDKIEESNISIEEGKASTTNKIFDLYPDHKTANTVYTGALIRTNTIKLLLNPRETTQSRRNLGLRYRSDATEMAFNMFKGAELQLTKSTKLKIKQQSGNEKLPNNIHILTVIKGGQVSIPILLGWDNDAYAPVFLLPNNPRTCNNLLQAYGLQPNKTTNPSPLLRSLANGRLNDYLLPLLSVSIKDRMYNQERFWNTQSAKYYNSTISPKYKGKVTELLLDIDMDAPKVMPKPILDIAPIPEDLLPQRRALLLYDWLHKYYRSCTPGGLTYIQGIRPFSQKKDAYLMGGLLNCTKSFELSLNNFLNSTQKADEVRDMDSYVIMDTPEYLKLWWDNMSHIRVKLTPTMFLTEKYILRRYDDLEPTLSVPADGQEVSEVPDDPESSDIDDLAEDILSDAPQETQPAPTAQRTTTTTATAW